MITVKDLSNGITPVAQNGKLALWAEKVDKGYYKIQYYNDMTPTKYRYVKGIQAVREVAQRLKSL